MGALRQWDKETGPYLIGLTGGSASGKSSVAKRMSGLSWGVVDCDKLGHAAYTPGTVAFKAIVEEWGQAVVAEDGSINRRALGPIVFADPSALARLNAIVWPEIARMAKEKADSLWKEGKQVVVLDAAVLLEADWQKFCHEVWVCVVPQEEAVTRIMDRDGKSRQEAERRVASQLSNAERVSRASTVLCTLWQPEVTQRQVEEAVKRVQGEISTSQGSLFVILPLQPWQLKIRLFPYRQLKIRFFQYHQLKNQCFPSLQQFICRKCTRLRNHKCKQTTKY